MNKYIWIGIVILFLNIIYISIRVYLYKRNYKKEDHYNENMPEEARG